MRSVLTFEPTGVMVKGEKRSVETGEWIPTGQDTLLPPELLPGYMMKATAVLARDYVMDVIKAETMAPAMPRPQRQRSEFN